MNKTNSLKKLDRIQHNLLFIRLYEDFFFQNNHIICDYNMVYNKPTKSELNNLCGGHMDEIIMGNLDDNAAFKYVILNSRKKIVSIITGYYEGNRLVDICRCSKYPGGGEVLLYYALLKFNTIYNVKFISGYISGAIPAINSNDSIETQQIKKERLIQYHLNRGAKLDDELGNIKFTYTHPNIYDNCDQLLNKGELQFKKARLQLTEARTKPLPLSDNSLK